MVSCTQYAWCSIHDMLHFVFSHTVNSNYYAMGVANPPTTHQLDRAAMHIYNSVM